MSGRQERGGQGGGGLPVPHYQQTNPDTARNYNNQHVRQEGMGETDSNVIIPPSPTPSEYIEIAKTTYSRQLLCINNGPAMTYSKRESFATITSPVPYHTTSLGSHGIMGDISGTSSNYHHHHQYNVTPSYYAPPPARHFESRYDDAPSHSTRQQTNPAFLPPSSNPSYVDNRNHDSRQTGNGICSTAEPPSSGPSDMIKHIGWWGKLYNFVKGCFIKIHDEILALKQQNAEDNDQLRRGLHARIVGIEKMLAQILQQGERQARGQQSEEELRRMTREINELQVGKQKLLWQIEQLSSKAGMSGGGGPDGGGQTGVPCYQPHYQEQRQTGVVPNTAQNAVTLPQQYTTSTSGYLGSNSAVLPAASGPNGGGQNVATYYPPIYHHHHQQTSISPNNTLQTVVTIPQQYSLGSNSVTLQNGPNGGGQNLVPFYHYQEQPQTTTSSNEHTIQPAPHITGNRFAPVSSLKRPLPTTSTSTYSMVADSGELPAPKISRMSDGNSTELTSNSSSVVSIRPPLGGPPPPPPMQSYSNQYNHHFEEAPRAMAGSAELFEIGDVMDALGEGQHQGNGDSHRLGLVGEQNGDEDVDMMGNEHQDEDEILNEKEPEYEESDMEDEDQDEVEDRSWLPAEYSHIELPVRPQSLARHVIKAINPIRDNKCLMCPRRERTIYTDAKTALRHALSEHGFPLRCTKCDGKFRRDDNFKTHSKKCTGEPTKNPSEKD